jgi:hypothetical protein
VNGHKIEMKEELSDIYNVQMCNYNRWKYFNPNALLKYDARNEVFYLYIKGGNTADHYFGKFVFDENKFITRYLVDYYQLSTTGSFRLDFKGF